ncbi:MAG: hypothetical protein JEZ14_06995 [Marinilabiliaceae bacterium]|nr:hypothetical protein [Marinilabiliaceae bacterium]
MDFKHQFFSSLTALGRKVYLVAGYHYLAMDNELLAKKICIKKRKTKLKLSKEDIKAYREKWKPLGKCIKTIHLENAFEYGGISDPNIVPSNIYYAAIEPALNNLAFSLGYEDKARIDWLNDPQHVPQIFLRNIHGNYYSTDQQVIDRVSIDVDQLINVETSIIAKKSIELHAGKGIVVFDKKSDGAFYNREGQKLSLEWLEKTFHQDFIVQKFVDQHEYYKKFNPTSLNTFRIFTYRSVKDNKVHVIYSYLRVGAPGKRVDNICEGGMFVCVKEDGHFADFGFSYGSEKIYALDGYPPFAEMERPYKIDEIWETAKKIASTHLYSRLLGFDIAVDNDGKILHIETNTSDIGMEHVQYVIGPLFHRFTDEIIEYTQEKLKTVPYYKLYTN